MGKNEVEHLREKIKNYTSSEYIIYSEELMEMKFDK